MAKEKDGKEKKEKKEKKFNSDRIARQVKASLSAVFPKDNFIVSSFVGRVEVLYFENTASVRELEIFNTIYCVVANVKKEQLVFSKIKRETATPAAPVSAAK